MNEAPDRAANRQRPDPADIELSDYHVARYLQFLCYYRRMPWIFRQTHPQLRK